MAARPLAPLDAGWLLVESDVAHMHVGTLTLLRPPDDAGDDFVHSFVAELRGHSTPVAPFDRRIVRGGLGRVWPLAESVDELDMEHHLRHEALPEPGGQRELGVLVSRLHSTPLDMSRPPWEFHVIEGLDDGRLAVYVKLHHSLVDGVGAVRLAEAALSTDPERQTSPIWAGGAGTPPSGSPSGAVSVPRTLGRWVGRAKDQAVAGLTAVHALALTLTGTRLPYISADPSLTRAYQAPDSVLNGAITAHRRVATQSFELERLRRLAKRLGVTLNDLTLAVCAGGLRRYLTEIDALPDRPLVAGLPVSVRPPDSDNTGSALTFALAGLATDVADARERVAAIAASSASGKHLLSSMPKDSVDLYTLGLLAPLGVAQMAGIGHWGSPVFNLIVSNVAGPQRTLYLNRARVEEIYPVSVVLTGQALNITAFSYTDRFSLSFTACRDRLPHLQRLPAACAEALDELEAARA